MYNLGQKLFGSSRNGVMVFVHSLSLTIYVLAFRVHTLV